MIKQDMSRVRGLKSKRNGQLFESMIERSCIYYSTEDIAYIQKTPEPMRMIRPTKRKGTVLAAFESKAQPDFTGTLKDGRSVVFEAKHTDKTHIRFDRIEPQQERDLNKHEKLNAKCFILVSFNAKNFYRINWNIWKELKETIGKKSVNEKDLKDFEVPTEQGLVKFLD